MLGCSHRHRHRCLDSSFKRPAAMTVLSATALESDPLGCSLLAAVSRRRDDLKHGRPGRERKPGFPRCGERNRDPTQRYFCTDPIGLAPPRIIEFDERLWEDDDRTPRAAQALI